MTLRSQVMIGGKIQARWHAQRLTRATGATVAVVLAAVGCTTTHPTAPTGAATATTTPTATAIATPTPAALTAAASVTHKHPIIGTKVGVLVSTTPNARITVVAHFPAENRERTARADATGLRTFWFQTATATPGYRVKVDVRVYAHGQKRFIRTWFTPRQKPPPPAPTRSNYLAFSRGAIWLLPQDQQWSLLRAGRILPACGRRRERRGRGWRGHHLREQQRPALGTGLISSNSAMAPISR